MEPATYLRTLHSIPATSQNTVTHQSEPHSISPKIFMNSQDAYEDLPGGDVPGGYLSQQNQSSQSRENHDHILQELRRCLLAAYHSERPPILYGNLFPLLDASVLEALLDSLDRNPQQPVLNSYDSTCNDSPENAAIHLIHDLAAAMRFEFNRRLSNWVSTTIARRPWEQREIINAFDSESINQQPADYLSVPVIDPNLPVSPESPHGVPAPDDKSSHAGLATAQHSPSHRGNSNSGGSGPRKRRRKASNSRGAGTRQPIELYCPYYERFPIDNPDCKEASFRHLSQLKAHIDTHLMQQQCSNCGKRFATKYDLKRHVEERKNPCTKEQFEPLCDADFQKKDRITGLKLDRNCTTEDVWRLKNQIHSILFPEGYSRHLIPSTAISTSPFESATPTSATSSPHSPSVADGTWIAIPPRNPQDYVSRIRTRNNDSAFPFYQDPGQILQQAQGEPFLFPADEANQPHCSQYFEPEFRFLREY